MLLCFSLTKVIFTVILLYVIRYYPTLSINQSIIFIELNADRYIKQFKTMKQFKGHTGPWPLTCGLESQH